MNNNIKIAFYKAYQDNASFINKAIAKWTRGPYSHVELIIDDVMYSAEPGNTVRCIEHNYDIKEWDYFTFSKELNIDNIIKFYHMTKGLKYDWYGIIGFISPIADRENKYFCSEWVTRAIIAGGLIEIANIDASKTSPNRLYHVLLVKELLRSWIPTK